MSRNFPSLFPLIPRHRSESQFQTIIATTQTRRVEGVFFGVNNVRSRLFTPKNTLLPAAAEQYKSSRTIRWGMQRSWSASHWVYGDWRSKLTDGIFASALLYLFWVLVALVIRPIELLYGDAGLLVYSLALLAASMFSFQLSLVVRYPDVHRAWYGIMGGVLAWSVVEVNSHIDLPMLSLSGFVPLIMVSLIVILLWRSHLPVGARFFSLTFLMNWAGVLLLNLQSRLAEVSPIFSLLYWVTGVVAVLVAILVLFWILFQTRRRIQRAGGALALWFLGSIILYIFRGPIF
jgi:hypothetical protein